MSVFGALLMYILSMAALFKLRRSQPSLARPYKAPLFPLVPAIALIGAVISLVTVVWFNLALAGFFAVLMVAGYGYFYTTRHRRESASFDGLLETGAATEAA
jgi:ethanolamine permease